MECEFTTILHQAYIQQLLFSVVKKNFFELKSISVAAISAAVTGPFLEEWISFTSFWGAGGHKLLFCYWYEELTLTLLRTERHHCFVSESCSARDNTSEQWREAGFVERCASTFGPSALTQCFDDYLLSRVPTI